MALTDSLGSLLGTNSSGPAYNSTALKNRVRQGADEQKGYIGNIEPKLADATGKLQGNIAGAEGTADEARRSTNNAFLDSLKSQTNTLTNDQFNSGKQKIAQSVQPAQDAIRETLAGSGVGLQGGAAIKQLSQPVLDAASKTNDLANSLTQGAQQSVIGAEGTLQGQDNAATLQKLGIDTDTYNTIMNSDRQDLKDELNHLLGISSQSTADELGIDQNQYTSELANNAANNQNRTQLLSSLLGAGGAIAGARIAGR